MNLVPEKRSDRNGNVVTRWVRSLKNRSRAAAVIPAPAPQSSVAKILHDEAYSVLYTSDNHRDPNCAENVAFMVEYDPVLLREVLDACARSDDYKSFWRKRFSNGYVAPQRAEYPKGETPPADIIEKKLYRVRKSLITTDEATKLFTHEDREHMFFESSAYYYVDGSGTVLAGDDPSEERLRAATVVAYIQGVHRRDWNGSTPQVPPSDVSYFTKNLDLIRPYIQQLFIRRATNEEFVKNVIDGSAALAEGSL